MTANKTKISKEPDSYSPESPYDYLELAEEALSERESLKYSKKALELDPDNLDAACKVAELSADNSFELLGEYQKIIKRGESKLKREGFFKDCKGKFWLVFETRPYMRARYTYMELLASGGMIKRAVAECEEMLGLCEGDNLGVRYQLMHLYAILEDKTSADKLLKKYNDPSVCFLLPYSVLHFKLGEYQKAAEILKKVAKYNKDTKKFLRSVKANNPEIIDEALQEMIFGVRVGTIDEFAVETTEYSSLFLLVPGYFMWAYETLYSSANIKAKRGKRNE